MLAIVTKKNPKIELKNLVLMKDKKGIRLLRGEKIIKVLITPC